MRSFKYAVLVFLFLAFAGISGGGLWARGKIDAPAVEEAATDSLLVYSVINEDATKALLELFSQKTGVKTDAISGRPPARL